MKTLLIFLATWILYASLLIYQSDFSRMNMMKWEVERIARQSASGGIQFFEAEAYSEGNMVVDEAAVRQFEKDFLLDEIKRNPKMSGGNLTLRLTTHNRETSPDEIRSQKVSAEAVYEEDNFFRLSFLKKDRITKSISYEVRGR